MQMTASCYERALLAPPTATLSHARERPSSGQSSDLSPDSAVCIKIREQLPFVCYLHPGYILGVSYQVERLQLWPNSLLSLEDHSTI
jgi:hypothetical protein